MALSIINNVKDIPAVAQIYDGLPRGRAIKLGMMNGNLDYLVLTAALF